MQERKQTQEVRYRLPVEVVSRFKVAAEIAGISVNQFIKRYTFGCTSVDVAKKRPDEKADVNNEVPLPAPTPTPDKAA